MTSRTLPEQAASFQSVGEQGDEGAGKGTPDKTSLALIALLLDREGCRNGNIEDATLRAIAHVQKVSAIASRWDAMTADQRVEYLLTFPPSRNSGAAVLLDEYSRSALESNGPLLVLAEDDAVDTLRLYLAEHANFEGKTSRKAWSRVRTVLDNLRAWFVDRANRHNTYFRDEIRSRESRAKEEAKRQGMPESRFAGTPRHRSEEWIDGESEFVGFIDGCATKSESGEREYSIPRRMVDEMIDFKRGIRLRGGIKSIRALTREDVWGKSDVEKKKPKK